MTAAQDAAMEEAVRLLGEHFHAAVLVLELTAPTSDEDSEVVAEYVGGRATALGLLAIGHDIIKRDEDDE